VCNKKIKIWEMEVCVKSKRGIIKSNNNNLKKKKEIGRKTREREAVTHMIGTCEELPG
jgi:hypothetical protein